MAVSTLAPEIRFLLDVIAARLGGAAPVPDSGIRWPLFLAAVRYHRVASLMEPALNPDVLVPEAVMAELARLRKVVAVQVLGLSAELARIVTAFKGSGVEVLGIKGPAQSVLFYGDLGIRLCRDFDLLVRPEAESAALEILRGLGYGETPEMVLRDPKHIALNHSHLPFLVDLHIRLSDDNRVFPCNLLRPFDNSIEVIVGQVPVLTLATEAAVVFAAYHGTQHLWRRLCWLGDMAVIVRSGKVDWPAALALARRMETERHLALALVLVEQLIGLPLPPAIGSESRLVARARRSAAVLLPVLAEGRTDTNQGFILHFGRLRYVWWEMSLFRRLATRWAFLTYWIQPSPRDRDLLHLPRGLSFLYYLVRVVRVLYPAGVASAAKNGVGRFLSRFLNRSPPPPNLLKILEVHPYFDPAHSFGGPITASRDLCRSIVANPTAMLRVLTTDAASQYHLGRLTVPAGWHNHPAGFPVRYCRTLWSPTFSLELFLALIPAVWWADVIHVNAVYSTPTPAVLLLARLMRRPVLWSPRGSLMEPTHSNRALKHWWDRACLILADRRRITLLSTGEGETLSIQRHLPGLKIDMLRHGVECPPEPIPWPNTTNGEDLRLMFLGRLHPMKGLENLIAAIALVQTPLRLTIYGSGPDNYRTILEEQVSRLGLSDRIHFSGFLAMEEHFSAFARHHALIFPTHGENFGMVVAEALAHGRPVIASKMAPWGEMTERGCGLWVDNQPHTLAAAIDRLSGMNMEAMGRRGHEWMRDTHRWHDIAEHFLQIAANRKRKRRE